MPSSDCTSARGRPTPVLRVASQVLSVRYYAMHPQQDWDFRRLLLRCKGCCGKPRRIPVTHDSVVRSLRDKSVTGTAAGRKKTERVTAAGVGDDPEVAGSVRLPINRARFVLPPTRSAPLEKAETTLRGREDLRDPHETDRPTKPLADVRHSRGHPSTLGRGARLRGGNDRLGSARRSFLTTISVSRYRRSSACVV